MSTRVLFVLCLFLASAYAGCASNCSRPAVYTNFTRLNLEEVRKEIRYYFPSSPTPPPTPFISDASTIPTMRFINPASLAVTFMFEGAGNRNQLGYFTYELNSTGGIINVNETLLFRDIETGTDYNRNCVWTGMTVTSQVIPADTYFGFFLIADGYCGGRQKYYTISSLNTPGDKDIRHVGLYVDYFRELLIIGFEDLLKTGWDNDFEDTMFIFDSAGVQIQFDGVPYACTHAPCWNGGVCNYLTGECDCSRTHYTGKSCTICDCSDGDMCTPDYCNGTSCIGSNYRTNISSCLGNQTCSHGPCTTTGIPTTGDPTTGIMTTGDPTTGIPTTGDPTTGVVTTGEVTTGVMTTGDPTTGNPTTGIPTTGNPTTGIPTTGLPTTGEYIPSNSRAKPNISVSLSEGNFPTVSSRDRDDDDELEGKASLFGLSALLAVVLYLL